MVRKPKKKSSSRISKNRKQVYHEVIGIFLIGLGIFAFLSIYTSSTGIIGKYYRDLLKGLFGIISYIIPAIIPVVGIFIIIAYYRQVNRTKLILSLVSLVFVMCLIHLVYLSKFDISDIKNFIISSYKMGQFDKGTGAFLAAIVYLLYKFFGISGSYVFLIVFFVIDLILLTDLSFKKAVNYMCDKIDSGAGGESAKSRKINRSKKGKPFTGEEIEFVEEEVSADKPNISLLQQSFEPNRTIKNEEQPPIKIIDFEKQDSISNVKNEEIKQSNNSKEKKSSNTSSSSDNNPIISLEHGVEKAKTEDIYVMPPISLLKQPALKKEGQGQDKQILNSARILEDTLNSFGVSAKVIQISRGPVITRYELQPAPGVKVSKIVNLADDIALNLAAPSVRIEAPIPGKAAVGVEVPNKKSAPVVIREVLESDEFIKKPSKLAFALGKDIAGKPIVADISAMPHLLIAGATGSGKSVCINTLINSIIYKALPSEVKLIMIDPKVVELSNYNGIPHLLIPVVTDSKKAAGALNWAVQEMVSRYKFFADNGVRDIERYNELPQIQETSTLPQIIVIIDELADLMMVAPGDVEDAICRLAQMARAAGIHLVIATQRPSVDVITGVIKANIPSRIAFAVSSQTDSRTILDMGGAEKLLGRGDMLFYPVGVNKPIRVQGAYISEKEVESIVNFVKKRNQSPEYDETVIDEIAVDSDASDIDDYDELLPEAIKIVVDAGQASISMLQRRLRVGYARAARLIDEMELRGIVSGFDGSKPRNVLISKEEFEDKFMD